MGGGCKKSFIMRSGGRGLLEKFYDEDWWDGAVGRIYDKDW